MTDEAQAEKNLDSTVLRLLLDTREPWSVDEIVREVDDQAARDAVCRLAAVGSSTAMTTSRSRRAAPGEAAELEIAD
jgi:hypothetical protein